MSIIEALKSEDQNLRVSNGRTWMVWDSTEEQWRVYARPRRTVHTLIITEDEAKAVQTLLEPS